MGLRMKLNRLLEEQFHEKRGILERVDYVWAEKVHIEGKPIQKGSLFFSVNKAGGGGWAFLGRHFNSIQGARKEARKYCNDKAAEILGANP